MQYFGLSPQADRRRLLHHVTAAFARLPYENLSKIIRYTQRGNVEDARESPAEIFAGHQRWGTGGTCFSLTGALLYLVRSLGFEADPILADRSYGSDTHCALVVTIAGQPHLLDPGFLLVDPVPLPSTSEHRIATPFHDVLLVPREAAGKVDLLTADAHRRRHRLTFKSAPVDDAEFLRAWDESFGWEMMRYPVLTRVQDQKQIYVRGLYHQVRDRQGVVRQEISPHELARRIATQFEIHPQVVTQALALWKDPGATNG